MAEWTFWSQFFTDTSLRTAFQREWNAHPNGIISWHFIPEIDAGASKAKQYRQVLKRARDEIAAYPRLFWDHDRYWSVAWYLDGLRDCADQVIAQREEDIREHETIWNAFEESLPFTRKPTRDHKQVLELWRDLRRAIVAKREDLSTSVVTAFFGQITNVILFLFTVLLSAVLGVALGCNLYPRRDPVQILLCLYSFKVAMDAIREGGFLFKFVDTIFNSILFIVKIYFTVFLAFLIISAFVRRELEPIEVLLLTATVITLYEGLNFYSRAARMMIFSIMFVVRFYTTYWLVMIFLDQVYAWYPHQFYSVLELYPFDKSNRTSMLYFHYLIIVLFLTVKFM